MNQVPTLRIRPLNDLPPRDDGDYVLYWMTMARRLEWNCGLQHAVNIAVAARKPLVILEALRCDYPWANDRLHQFVLDGMTDNARQGGKARALYYPYVEPSKGHARGLLEALAERAHSVVADWYPAFFLPRMLATAATQVDVRCEAVDSNGLIPLAAADRAFPLARSFRAFVQRSLSEHLASFPEHQPLARLKGGPRLKTLPPSIIRRWPRATDATLRGGTDVLSKLPIDHTVGPVEMHGGSAAGRARLTEFVRDRLPHYDQAHNHPDEDGTSRLSPYLHFGHLSAHEIFAAVMKHERWTTRQLKGKGGGKREGWWGVSRSAEAFLDQLTVWRELAFNTCEKVDDYASYESLPEWARRTLAEHARDRRPHSYSLAQLEAAATHDTVWNAAQRQMRAEGWFHGYLRMLWGKKILEWSPTPREALRRMEAIMNRYSLDARDPNSYAGYAWVLGRYDRPWPRHEIFGTVRYMTSASAKRKLKMKAFLARYGDAPATASKGPARRARR